MRDKIQILRALAIFAVVMIHSNATGAMGVTIRPFINFSVALFIFCSGYLTKLEITDLPSFYKKRLSKILIPYFIWSLIYTVVNVSYSSFLRNLLTANAISPFYYVSVYAQFVILTPLIGIMLKSKYRWIGWFVTPVSIFVI